MRADADRPVAVADLDVEAELALVDDLASVAVTVSRAPSNAPPTCLTQTSKPTVGGAVGLFVLDEPRAAHSMTWIIPGVERTLRGSEPPTSVSRSPSATNSSRARRAHHIDSPPLTLRVWPVT